MKRLAIFSFFDKDGFVDRYVEILLRELREISSFLVIAVNGKLDKDGKELFERYADNIVIRKNIGHDGGAYADVCINHIGEKKLSTYDEVIFTNDTFFGPFISLQNIFAEMEVRNCDFWGLNIFRNGFWSFIESYFLVFRKKVIQNKDLIIFCTYILNGLLRDPQYSYNAFELGIYHDLTNKGYKAGYYTDTQNTSIYSDPDICIAKYGLPILKKKSFSPDTYDEDKGLYALNYVKNKFDYDIRPILKCVKRKYGINISEDQVVNYDMCLCREKKYGDLYVPKTIVTDKEILNFLDTGTEIYIYGAGLYAKIIWYLYERYIINFGGFVISDDRYNKEMEFCGYVVKKYSDVKEKAKIILGITKKSSEEVIQKIGENKNVLVLWKE